MSLPASATPSQDQALTRFGQLALQFEANQGQLDPAIRYISRGAGYSLLLTDQGPEISLQYQEPSASDGQLQLVSSVLKTRLVGASDRAVIAGEDRQVGASHYLTGADASHWHTDVARWGRVRYGAVYPGIDLVFHGDQQQLEYDFVVAPGADPSRIAMRFEGADAPRLDASGNVVIKTPGGELVQQAPVAYQEIDGQRRKVDSAYRLVGEQVAFTLGAYDRSRPLVIDPLLGYKLYVPGVNVMQARTVAVGADGSAYIAGYAPSAPWISRTPVVRKVITYDAFVAKLNPAGNKLLYTTFIGGSADDEISAIAVDAAGNVTMAGYTRSNEFPVRNALQETKGGYTDGFVAKLGPTGKTLLFSTFLGGNSDDAITGLAIGPAGSIYVVGQTTSENFPTQGPLGAALHNSSLDGFVARISAAGNVLLYSGFLGGSDSDAATGIAVDAAGNAYVTGNTVSTDFPTTANAYKPVLLPTVQGSYSTVYGDMFLAKINPAGNALLFSTYFGGSSEDYATAIAVDAAGSAYLTGFTRSSDFPTRSPIQASSRAGDAFVTKFSPAGNTLVYSTYLGGSGYDYGYDIKLDASGAAWVTGLTFSSNFPTRLPLQGYIGGAQDVFVSKLAANGASLEYSSFFGAGGNEAGVKLGFGADGSIYVVGNTTSRNFPVKGQVQGASFGAGDAFAARLVNAGRSLAYSTYLGETNIYLNYTLTGYTGTSPEDPALNVAVPLRGLIGCSLRALPTDIIGDLSVVFQTRIPCGQLTPPP